MIVEDHLNYMETFYKGRKMRSQLEARWASFFDKVGWEYDYEPALDLNGWIPDFILYASDYTDDDGKEKKHKILVEVKPFSTKKEFIDVQEKIDLAIKGTAFENEEVLLLGSSIFKSKIYKESEYTKATGLIGWLYQIDNRPSTKVEKRTKLISESYVVATYPDKKTYYDLTDHNMFSRFQGYWSHCYGASYSFDWSHKLDYLELKELWDKAGNEIQWTKN